jgi:ABC-2 type transport system permease protein
VAGTMAQILVENLTKTFRVAKRRAGLVTQCFWGAIRLMIVAAFYAAATQAQPMSLPEVVVYIWLGQAFFGMLPWNIDEEFAQKVRDGSVAYDLLRPVDLYAF